MLRLELEAQVANAQAEVESMAADVAVEHGRRMEPPAADAAGSDVEDAEDAEVAATDGAEEPASAPTADDPVDEAPPA
jgi:hypothetical protein